MKFLMVLMTRVLVTDGNEIDYWWTEGDLTRFTALGTALADQYSALEPLPGVHVDGKFTLGENIGDLGGVNAAYDGLQLLKENKSPGLIDGFTQSNVSLFLGPQFGEQNHVTKRLKSSKKTDPHSPGMYRAYVPTQNVDAFLSFDIKRRRNVYRT
jgi:endothelin-converting enzyme/putative endopeptidase